VSARILVIDDNRANLELALYLLRAFGYEAEAADDAPGGLAAASASKYDAVLVDILMPVMDGYEFARRFRADASLASVPLVAITALAMVGDRERIVSHGFDGYIAKPIDPTTFVRQVESYLPEISRSTSPPAGGPEAPPVFAARDQDGPLVLAVDNVQSNLDVIRASLEPFGYRILDARSVDEALELLKRHRPAVILSDLHMPKVDGLVLIEKVRELAALRDVPFVFLSSTAWQAKDRHRALELGAKEFIMRPIDPALLRAEIETLIGREVSGNRTDR
jgi:two-component system, cell cycle response regulator